ncbi:MAG: hypothetical protein ACTS22_00225 [Phycisphaerales bacterium]
MAQRQRARSASDLRSSSALATPNTGIHKLYMRIGSLEMERARRMQERDACLARVRQCEARCEQLAAEIRELLERIGVIGATTAVYEPKPEPGTTARYSY